jgi:hypothetical protein
MDRTTARTLLTSQDLIAAHPWIKQSFLDYKAWAGGGPPFYKVGRRRLYDLSEFNEWVQTHRRTSTSGNAQGGEHVS